ncbi:MAG: 2-oxo acid dehydrogenase subunit E2 [Candidatus Eisenbacteria bacterium]|uniref:Dihydrolipoamide acetyltransferase component of pyruvate dehydrogenase complex n=1 Tax=Eiseniibacteriota bacterium TaxID=2212470 RepID=A0A538U6C3_UNCEI|nr:MAG: 2-oxo acid dehydrogenase subunit E2 [Candidatus Eisenbacteria bacterium]
MPISIVVPQLGESVAEGTVARWLKAQGDRVRKEEPLVEIQTDKINVEIPSPAEGTLASILVAEGTTVLVGTEIAVLAAPDEVVGGKPAAAPALAPAVAPAPAATPARARAAAPPPAPPAAAPEPAYASHGNGGMVASEGRNLSPAVRKIMREQGVRSEEISAIRGSGLAGRVTRDDLLEYLSRRVAAPAAATAAAAAPPLAVHVPLPGYLAPQAPAAGALGPREEVIPFTRVRKLIAENMVRAKHTAAHTHCFDEADMSAIVALRKEWAPKLEAQGAKLTYMPFFIKASVLALKEFPWVNGEVRGETMVLKRYYHIGMAVGRDEKGLIVPNLKDCDRKNLVQLAAEVNDLAARARNDRLKPDDIVGGTFSITNAGVYGAINSAPVINVPEVAILGVHKIVERPVIRDGQIVARPMMNASIGFDHRVVDGELAVKFLRRVCELLERPELLWFYA